MNEPVERFDWNDRHTFLRAGIVVELVVLLVGLGLGWLAGINPWLGCRVTPVSIAWGVAATGPLLLAFGVTYTLDWAPLRRIRELLIELLGRPMARCRWYDLVVLAVLAGVCEELLFRGVIQPWTAPPAHAHGSDDLTGCRASLLLSLSTPSAVALDHAGLPSERLPFIGQWLQVHNFTSESIVLYPVAVDYCDQVV